MRLNFLIANFLAAITFVAVLTGPSLADDRPNILWLSVEDIGPQIGCYGDEVANTPTLDKFAKQGLVYDLAWSNYPVCAPARTTIITGMYASANSAGNMRSEVVMPKGVKMFPEYLRESGYYCTNNKKTDYNYQCNLAEVWDASSTKAHYRNRKTDQPFFAVFNHTGTHESKIRKRPHEAVTDAAAVKLPKYWPDHPEVRKDFAQYYDNINVMDGWIDNHLKQLEKSGQADNTIVVIFGDHGSGMPRHKRYAGDSGMLVPFIVYVPEKLKALAGNEYSSGGRSKRPVGFIDLAPTMLSLAGIEPPEYMQGHAFMGKHQSDPPKYLYGFRDRMDERMDISRSIRDERFIYIRNYMPHLSAAQFVEYQHETLSTSVWKELFDAGKLDQVQSQFWKPRAGEELYDLKADPDETVNLAGDPKMKEVLQRFRNEHRDSYTRFGDLGLVPESIAFDFGKSTRSRREMLADGKQFPLDELFKIANIAANKNLADLNQLHTAAEHSSASVRYWAAIGIQVDGKESALKSKTQLARLTNDPCAAVAVVASEVLAKFGDDTERANALKTLAKFADLRNANYYASIQALNAIDRLDQVASSVFKDLKNIPKKSDSVKRGGGYVGQLLKAISP
ncbi:MAG: sulfatase [Mariniblastus sp.]